MVRFCDLIHQLDGWIVGEWSSCGGLNSGGGQTISGGVGLPVGISDLLVFCGSVPGCVWLCGSVYVKGFGGRGVEGGGNAILWVRVERQPHCSQLQPSAMAPLLMWGLVP